MSDPTKTRLEAGGLPLWNAVFCLDCEVISNSRGNECPVCNSRSLVSLARILGGSLFVHHEQLSQEGENAKRAAPSKKQIFRCAQDDNSLGITRLSLRTRVAR